MKKLIVALMLLLMMSAPAIAGDYKFYFFGVDHEMLKSRNWPVIAVGAATAVATHFAGHVIYAKAKDMDVSYEGFWRETINHPQMQPKSDIRNFARAGFVLQAVVATILTSFEASRRWDFTRGYVIGSALETWTYDFRKDDTGDLRAIDWAGGNGNLEWGAYSLIAIHNVLRVPWAFEKGEKKCK